MGEAPLILGVSGLRGIVGESLTPEVAARYAGAFGAWLSQRNGNNPKVIIGRDGRLGGETIYHAAISGLLGAGCDVVQLGVVTTPTVGVCMYPEGADGGMVVTASHNPQQWNGLKCLVADEIPAEQLGGEETPYDESVDIARAPNVDEAEEIIEMYRRGPGYEVSGAYRPLRADHDAAEYHWSNLHVIFWHLLDEETQQRETLGFRCVLSSVNASGSTVGVPFLDCNGEVCQLHCASTGVFPHTPEPTKENLSGEGGLCDAVPGLKADVGFAQDPDADRLAIVDEMGEYIGEEYTLVLAALSLLEVRKANDQDRGVLVTNLSTSRMIDDVAARYGARVERTAVGEANVVERMKALKQQGEDVILGGEGNGGVIWPEVVYVRDSLGAMALTLALMARKGMKVSELVSWIDSMAGVRGDGYVILKRKVGIPSKDAAAPAVEAVRRGCEGEDGAVIDLQDGVRVDWPGERAWVHVRASNTEPIMRVICEAPSEGAAETLLARIEGMIAAG